MYMPGRLRTGSRPSRTVMSLAVYVVGILGQLIVYQHVSTSRWHRRDAVARSSRPRLPYGDGAETMAESIRGCDAARRARHCGRERAAARARTVLRTDQEPDPGHVPGIVQLLPRDVFAVLRGLRRKLGGRLPAGGR